MVSVTSATNAPMAIRGAYEYCRQVTRRASKTFYWASLFLPRSKRLAAWAVYALCRSVDDIADAPTSSVDPLVELAAWRQRLQQVYVGTATQPIMVAWADMLERYPVPLQPALELINGVQTDLGAVRFGTFAELHRYCYRVAGTVGLLMAPVLGYQSAEALPCAVNLGIAMQLTNILRDVGEDALVDRIYLPAEDLAQFGYTEADLLAGLVNESFTELMRFQIARARRYYALALPGIALLDPAVQLAIRASAELYGGILNVIAANHYDVFTQRAHVPLAAKVLMLPRLWLRQQAGNLIK